MDIVGTGGDRLGTFNISTTTAFVAAGAGIKVAKHGNRSVSSRSGAAGRAGTAGREHPDGRRRLPARALGTGLCFLFAPAYHASMRHAAPVRRELGVRTVFNVLGPLSNPARAEMELMGVFSDELVEPLAHVLKNLGVQSGMVVCGDGRMDEATLTGPTRFARIRDGRLETGAIQPSDAGLSPCALEDLVGGDAAENARITRDILAGKERGPRRDVVLLNAALALLIAGIVTDLRFGVTLAAGVIDSGRAARLLADFARFSAEATS
jgi:anthranilate phosphoribosyltransferase